MCRSTLLFVLSSSGFWTLEKGKENTKENRIRRITKKKKKKITDRFTESWSTGITRFLELFRLEKTFNIIESGAWKEKMFKVPSNPSHSMILSPNGFASS